MSDRRLAEIRVPRHEWFLILTLLLSVVAAGCSDSQPPPLESKGGGGRPAASRRASEPAVGRWREAPRAGASERPLTAEQEAEIHRLEAVGYAAGGREASERWGVTRFDAERSSPGLNLIVSAHAPEAVLLDATGREVHHWRLSFEQAFPGREPPNREATYWRRAWALEDGSLLAIFEGHGLIEIDHRSRLVWASDVAAHHDLHLEPDGTIWVLTRQAHVVPRIRRGRPILEDFVSILDPNGHEIDRFSILEVLERSDLEVDWRGRVDEVLEETGDIFHTNTLERLAQSHPAGLAGFEKGNFLLSMPRLDLVAVLDPRERVLRWAAHGPFHYQHDPQMLADGDLLIFDNGTEERGSRVLEIDPVDGEIVWSYSGSATEPFFSETCGLAQRLPNGNTLITETEAGRAFEVTRQGEIVWEYLSPHRVGKQRELVAMLMEVTRLPWRLPPAWAQPGDATGGVDG